MMDISEYRANSYPLTDLIIHWRELSHLLKMKAEKWTSGDQTAGKDDLTGSLLVPSPKIVLEPNKHFKP